jgi:hypothetical protein
MNMKKKEIINLIRTKADQTAVPDVRKTIKGRLSELKWTKTSETVGLPRKTPSRRLVFASFSAVLVVMAVSAMVLFNPSPQVTFSAMEEAVVMSAIYADGLLQEDIETVSVGETDLDAGGPVVGGEVSKIATYIDLVDERLMIGQAPEAVLETLEDGRVRRSFETVSWTGASKGYVIETRTQTTDPSKGLIAMEGTLETPSGRRALTARTILEDGTHALVLTLGNTSSDHVTVTYLAETGAPAVTATLTRDGTAVRTVEFISQEDDASSFTMHFTSGDIIGTYRFNKDASQAARAIGVTYALIDSEGNETGTIGITLEDFPSGRTIVFDIRARGKAPSTVRIGPRSDETDGNL